MQTVVVATLLISIVLIPKGQAELVCRDPGLKVIQSQLRGSIDSYEKLVPLLEHLSRISLGEAEARERALALGTDVLRKSAQVLGYTTAIGVGGGTTLVFLGLTAISVGTGNFSSAILFYLAYQGGAKLTGKALNLVNSLPERIRYRAVEDLRVGIADPNQAYFYRTKSGSIIASRSPVRHETSDGKEILSLGSLEIREFFEDRALQFKLARKGLRSEIDRRIAEQQAENGAGSTFNKKELLIEGLAARAEAELMRAELGEMKKNLQVVENLCMFATDPKQMDLELIKVSNTNEPEVRSRPSRGIPTR